MQTAAEQREEDHQEEQEEEPCEVQEEREEQEDEVVPPIAEAEDPTQQGKGDDRPALKSATLALARQLTLLHAASDVALKVPGGRLHKCRRDVVATWSFPFQSLMNSKEAKLGLEGQLPVVEVHAAADMLETVVRFMCEGRITFQAQLLNDSHELLSFADSWGLDDLKATYGEIMMAREGVTAKNAAAYLQLGMKFAIANITALAADALAGSIDGNGALAEKVLSLDAACMQAIFASDNLHVQEEAKVLQLIQVWAEVDMRKRSQDVPDLLAQVRLSLCSFQTLIDLVSNLSKDPWQQVDAKRLHAKVRKVVDEKLEAITSDRLRRTTKLPTTEQEQKIAYMFQASKSIYEV